jgi:hypothetical protein
VDLRLSHHGALWAVRMSLVSPGGSDHGSESMEAPKLYHEPLRIALATKRHAEVPNCSQTFAKVRISKDTDKRDSSEAAYQHFRLELVGDGEMHAGSDTSSEDRSLTPDVNSTCDSQGSSMGSYDSGTTPFASPYLHNDDAVLWTDEAVDSVGLHGHALQDLITGKNQQIGCSAETVAGKAGKGLPALRQRLRSPHCSAYLKAKIMELAAEVQAEFEDGDEADASTIDVEMHSDIELARRLGTGDM